MDFIKESALNHKYKTITNRMTKKSPFNDFFSFCLPNLRLNSNLIKFKIFTNLTQIFSTNNELLKTINQV
ncbi:MAG: hypothetical protein AUK46_09760 [Flavobacteriaceae bacterium CG2_30_31_66]|nr:MAG: hypothetical protein AUK46_09760 [Flavobacteriaceae bacterium CG2_30_31_66]